MYCLIGPVNGSRSVAMLTSAKWIAGENASFVVDLKDAFGNVIVDAGAAVGLSMGLTAANRTILSSLISVGLLQEGRIEFGAWTTFSGEVEMMLETTASSGHTAEILSSFHVFSANTTLNATHHVANAQTVVAGEPKLLRLAVRDVYGNLVDEHAANRSLLVFGMNVMRDGVHDEEGINEMSFAEHGEYVGSRTYVIAGNYSATICVHSVENLSCQLLGSVSFQVIPGMHFHYLIYFVHHIGCDVNLPL